MRLSSDLLGVLAGALSLTAAGCAATIDPASAAAIERSDVPTSPGLVVMQPIGEETPRVPIEPPPGGPESVDVASSFEDDPTWGWNDVEVEEDLTDPEVEAEDSALTLRLERAKRTERRRLRLAHRPRPPIHPACGRG